MGENSKPLKSRREVWREVFQIPTKSKGSQQMLRFFLHGGNGKRGARESGSPSPQGGRRG